MVTDAAAAPEAPATGRRLRPTPSGVLVGVLVLAGLVIRLVILRSPVGALDSDEAVVGLMARQMGHGHFRAFYWGQDYGGSIEPAVAAMLFAVFGATTTVLKLVPLAFNAAAAAVLWRVGRRVTTPLAAAAAALAMWLWPANYLWWSIKERGFYEVTLLLSVAIVLLALRIVQESGARWLDWTALGLCTGLGWWQDAQIAYVAVPVAVWLLYRLRQAAWHAVAALPTAAIGVLPWLVANLNSGFASLTPPASPVPGSYGDHLNVLVRTGLPMTFGLQIVYSSARWIRPTPLTVALYAVFGAAVVVGAASRWPGGRLITLLLIAFPFLHSLLSLASSVDEGRYTLVVLPWLALAMAHAVAGGAIPQLDRRIGTTALAAALAVTTGLGLPALHDRTSPFIARHPVPASLHGVELALEQRGIDRVWANYWVAYRLTFETGDRVVAAPTLDDRNPALRHMVGSAASPAAHLFLRDTPMETAFVAGLSARRIRYRSFASGPWVVYRTAVPVGGDVIPGSVP
jgi:hypothetical protein